MSIATTEALPPTGRPNRLHLLRPERGSGLALPATLGAALHVPTLTGSVAYANFDHAASTPALVSVKAAVDAALETYSSVHRGNGYPSRVTSAWYEQAREEVASFVGAREGDTVLFTRNTTDSFNLLARSLPQETHVLVFAGEHHSTLLPWPAAQTSMLPVPTSVEHALSSLDAALAHLPSRHRLVVVSGASNVTGEVWPLEQVVQVARRHRARVAVDAAQLAPHRRVDMGATGVDYVAFSGHKLYAPFGAGVLAGRADWLDQAAPYLRGGGATTQVSPAGASWATGPARHEGGSPNVVGAIAIAAACAALAEHRAAVESHERYLLGRLRQGLKAIPGVQTWSIFGEDHDRVAVVTFTIEGLDSSLVSALLSAEHGIGVRDGKFCAHILVDRLLAGRRGSAQATAVRASMGLANTEEHVDRLLAAVRALATHPPVRGDVQAGDGWPSAEGAPELAIPRPW